MCVFTLPRPINLHINATDIIYFHYFRSFRMNRKFHAKLQRPPNGCRCLPSLSVPPYLPFSSLSLSFTLASVFLIIINAGENETRRGEVNQRTERVTFHNSKVSITQRQAEIADLPLSLSLVSGSHDLHTKLKPTAYAVLIDLQTQMGNGRALFGAVSSTCFHMLISTRAADSLDSLAKQWLKCYRFRQEQLSSQNCERIIIVCRTKWNNYKRY